MVDPSNTEPLRYFVDSNIIGYLIGGHSIADAYLDLLGQFSELEPSMARTVHNEIEAGLARLDLTRPEQHRLNAKMREAMSLFDIVDLDDQAHEIAASLKRRARKVGHPIGADHQARDLEIAALAIRHRAPLVSHNYRDFTNIADLDLHTLATINTNPPRIEPLNLDL